jgi:alpha-galactosidase
MIGTPDPDPPQPEQCQAVTPPGLLAPVPAMGWNGWNTFGCSKTLNEQKLRDIVEALTASGMQDAGYRYVNLDDCWELARDDAGDIVVDAAKLPGGMTALGTTLHAKGFRLGVFRRGSECPMIPAAHHARDVATYDAWQADLLKLVSCTQSVDVQSDVEQMAAALRDGDRPVILSIAAPPFAEWMTDVGQMFRGTSSIAPTWASILTVLDATAPLAAYARPGAFNDPDILEVGNGELSESEARAHFSLWSILSAPLLAGNDVSTMSEATQQILLNGDVIALDQDALGLQGALVRNQSDLQIYAKPLVGCGARGVVLFNRGEAELTTTLTWPEIWLEPGSASVRDLWQATELGPAQDQLTLSVPAHDVVALKIVGNEPPTPHGDVSLGDVHFTYATSGFGPVERNTSNGEQSAGDGKMLRISGRTFERGLGVHAPALLRFRLGGACSRFTAQVGVDEEEEGLGSVNFQVWSDGEKLFDSGQLTGTSAAQAVDVSLTGRQDLRLFVGTAGDGYTNDHADWADAHLTCDPEPVAR